MSEKREIVVAGRADAEAVRSAMTTLWAAYAPNVSIALLDGARTAPEGVPLFEGKTAGDDDASPRFYVCENYACQAPTDDLEEVVAAL